MPHEISPRPGIQPMPPAVEAQSLNHWTTNEVPQLGTFTFYLQHWNEKGERHLCALGFLFLTTFIPATTRKPLKKRLPKDSTLYKTIFHYIAGKEKDMSRSFEEHGGTQWKERRPII